jgi:hypothetical protein
MSDTLRIPYTQQFTPEQTPLKQLLPILRQHQGDRRALKAAIAAAFFKNTKTPEKIAGNTLISLGVYGILGDAKLTTFGDTLVGLHDCAKATRELARRILLEMDGVAVVETLREMKSAGLKISLGTTLPQELRRRGFVVSSNSSDLSGMLGWLRSAGVLQEYDVNTTGYKAVLGTDVEVVGELKKLSSDQLHFLRALVALGAVDFIDHSMVCDHAEGLYPGQVRFNRKELDRTLLRPLQRLGYIEVRRREKSLPGARGGQLRSSIRTLARASWVHSLGRLATRTCVISAASRGPTWLRPFFSARTRIFAPRASSTSPSRSARHWIWSSWAGVRPTRRSRPAARWTPCCIPRG